MDCSSCGQAAARDARFCSRCGKALESAAPSLPERRQLTVMFCDLVDSTELSQRIDSEALRELIQLYHATCGEIIRSFEGWVAQYLGDGVLAYFGFPLAHEDDAFRAVSAAVAIQRAVAGLHIRLSARIPELAERRIQIRIGVHTGSVIVGPLGAAQHETLASGDTANIASRLQVLAQPEEILVSGATRHLVVDRFAFEEIGARTLRGVATPILVHRVSGAREADEGPGPTRVTPLVGREHELALLMDRWERSAAGRGQMVLVSGEPGIGKTRLVHALRESLAATPHRWLASRASAYHTSTAFHALVELIEKRLGIRHDTAPPERLAKIERALVVAGRAVAAPLAGLLGVPAAGQPASLDLAPDAARRLLMDSAVELLAARAPGEPAAVLIVEDLHWVDPSTLEVLELLAERVARAPVLILLTARSGAELASLPGLVRVALNPLTRRQTESLILEVARKKPLPAAIAAAIVEKTDGVPLFAEELTKSVLESGMLREGEAAWEVAGPIGSLSIPSTLQDSLMARLDRLGEAKRLAQLGAVVGREFDLDLLERIGESSRADLERDARRLEEAGLLFRRADSDRERWVFKHALVQDTAYQSMLRSPRRELHARIATALADATERPAADPELIARHFDAAELPELAIPHYQRAGEQAADRSADEEAVDHLGRAIELLTQPPWNPERASRELRLRVSLGVLMMARAGAIAPEVEAVFARVAELCEALDESRDTSRALFGLSVFHQARGELARAHELGQLLLERAERVSDDSYDVSAHLSLGVPLFWTGQPLAAREHLELAALRYDPDRHRDLAYVYGQDPGVTSRSYLALVLWQLGFADQALGHIRDAIDLARDDLSRVFARSFAALLHWMRCELDRALPLADEVIVVARERNFALWLGAGELLRGRALAETRPGPDVVAELGAAIGRLQSAGIAVAAPLAQLLLAEALRVMGRPADALSALDAQAGPSERRPALFESELLRLRAAIQLEEGAIDAAAAETLLRRALDVARAQGAVALELRAALALAKLGRDDGALAQARARIHEGADTQDVRDADQELARVTR